MTGPQLIKACDSLMGRSFYRPHPFCFGSGLLRNIEGTGHPVPHRSLSCYVDGLEITLFNGCYSGPLQRQVFGVALGQQGAERQTGPVCIL
jgi:hypothetical protein